MTGPQESQKWVIVTHAFLPNGPAHRLLDSLRSRGLQVGFCALPMPGVDRMRAERCMPGDTTTELLIDRKQLVPKWRELLIVIELYKFARRLRSADSDRFILVGCDPVSYLVAYYVFRMRGLHVLADAVWFVDWSAHRLKNRWTGTAYRAVSRLAARRARVVCAISAPASLAVAELTGRFKNEEILVLPNLPLVPSDEMPRWESRPLGVVYLGRLSDEHGAELLLRITPDLIKAGYELDVAGDGPAADAFASAAKRISGFRYHGLVTNPQDLIRLLLTARIGLALYDPMFPMFGYNDPLKVKDYLSAGLRVVATINRDIYDDVVLKSAYTAEGLIKTILAAGGSGPTTDPRKHWLLNDADLPLRNLIERLEETARKQC